MTFNILDSNLRIKAGGFQSWKTFHDRSSNTKRRRRTDSGMAESQGGEVFGNIPALQAGVLVRLQRT